MNKKTSFASLALFGAVQAQNAESFRDIPPGDDYIYHYPNNVKYAFGDLSGSFPEHIDYTYDGATEILEAEIPTVIEGMCDEARFNGFKLTIHAAYEDTASENMRRKIVNAARAEDACEEDHLMFYASTPDFYDSYTDDYNRVNADYVAAINDYIFTYWPEFISPFTGADLTKAEMVALLEDIDADLETRTLAYLDTNGPFNPIPWEFRLGEGEKRPAWSMAMATPPPPPDRRLEEASPRDSVRRLSAVAETPEEMEAHARRLAPAGNCDPETQNIQLVANQLYAGIDSAFNAAPIAGGGVSGTFIFGWYYIQPNGGDRYPFDVCDGVTGVRITGCSKTDCTDDADHTAVVLFDNTKTGNGDTLQSSWAQTWAKIDLDSTNCQTFASVNNVAGHNACFLLDQWSSINANGNDGNKDNRYFKIELESNVIGTGDEVGANGLFETFSFTNLIQQGTDAFPAANNLRGGSLSLYSSHNTDLKAALAADNYFDATVPTPYTELYSDWDEIIDVSTQSRTQLTIGWNSDSTPTKLDNLVTAGTLENLRMLILVPDFVWYADYTEDWAGEDDNQQQWKSTICNPATCTLANRAFTLSNAQETTINAGDNLWESGLNGNALTPGPYDSPWCNDGDAGCDNTKASIYPKKFIEGQEVRVFVTGVYKDEQYIEEINRPVYITDKPGAPTNVISEQSNNYFYRDADDYKIEWTAPTDTGALNFPIEGYRVFYYIENSDPMDQDNTGSGSDFQGNFDAPAAEGSAGNKFVSATSHTLSAELTEFPRGSVIGYHICTVTIRGLIREESGAACTRTAFIRSQMPAVAGTPTGVQDGGESAGWEDSFTVSFPRPADGSVGAGYTDLTQMYIQFHKLSRDEVLGTDTSVNLFAPATEYLIDILGTADPMTLQILDNQAITLTTDGTGAQKTFDLTYGETYYMRTSYCIYSGSDYADSAPRRSCHVDAAGNLVWSPWNAVFTYANKPGPATNIRLVSKSVQNGFEIAWNNAVLDNGADITNYKLKMVTTTDGAVAGFTGYEIDCALNNPCTIKDSTFATSQPQTDINYNLLVAACNVKGCSDYITLSEQLISAGQPDPPAIHAVLIANQYQISIALEEPVELGGGTVTGYEGWWDEGDDEILEEETEKYVEAVYLLSDSTDYTLDAADFPTNSYVDTSGENPVTYYIYTIYHTVADNLFDTATEYCFRFKTVVDNPATSDFSDAVCVTPSRHRVSQIVGPDFPRIEKGSPNTVKNTKKWLLQEDELVPENVVDYTEHFDYLGAYVGWGDQSSRRKDWQSIVDYGNDDTLFAQLETFNTLTSGEWYRSTTGRGRWAINLTDFGCNYPEPEEEGGRMLASNNSQSERKENGTNPGNKEDTWWSEDDKPMPSATEAIDAGVRAISPRLVVPRFINATDGKPSCRTLEWINGGWAQATDDTYNARSTKTRNHNKCGSGTNQWGQGKKLGRDAQYEEENPRGPMCPYESYNEVGAGVPTTASSRWEPECISYGDGIATIGLDTYRPCATTVQVPSVEETGFNTVQFTATFEGVSAFVEECYDDGRCFYEEVVSGEQYTFVESSEVNVNLVLENNQAEPTEIQVVYDYSFTDSVGIEFSAGFEGVDNPTGAVSGFMTSVFAFFAAFAIFMF